MQPSYFDGKTGWYTFIRFENTDGIEVNYYVAVSGGSIWINLFDES